MAEPETGLITDCEMTMAAGPGSSDAENGVTMAARDRFCDPGAGAGPGGELDAHAGAGQGAGSAAAQQATGLEVYGDSAYASGEARAAYREAGHDTVIKPEPLRPAVPSLTAAGSASVRHLTHARAATLGAIRPGNAGTRKHATLRVHVPGQYGRLTNQGCSVPS